uniref:Uncharacterized protein n=1 Tax=Anguilla anguilla TaxID=7936 RepID=A0A0E9S9H4_ANGAN
MDECRTFLKQYLQEGRGQNTVSTVV